MLDGAGASTFLDLIDEHNQQEIKKNSKIIDTSKENNELPFANVARDQTRKSVVFIDSAVPDYETIINSFKENTEFYLINSNEDGFKKIDEILNDRKDIDALHIIGHGSAGQILFGNAFLNNDTITNYQATLASIGQSLTTSGDILFYGCNVASTEQGEILIKKISEITKADIAASDDLTGKDGDWDLEKEEGFIDVKKLKVKNYDHSLDSLTTSGIVSGSGVTHIASGNVDMLTSSQTKMGIRDRGIYSHISSPNTQYGLALERSNVSVASGKIISNINIDVTDTGLSDQLTSGNAYIAGDSNQTASESMTVNSYLVAYVGNQNRTSSSRFGSAVFDGEIVGIFFDQAYTRGQTVNGVQYHSSSFTYDMRNNSHTSNVSDSDGGRVIENPNFYAYNRTSDSVDWVSVGNYGSGTNNYLSFGFTNNNAKTGDYIRVIVKQIESNSAPVAVNDTDSVNEDATVTRTTGSNLKMADDSDPDGDSITVTQIAKTGASNSSVAGSSTYNSNGTSVTGTYGTLVVGANGTYTYVADQSAADDLDAGDTATDSFTYTISDGEATDTATLVITVTGVNDAPVAVNDTDAVNEDATVTRTTGSSLLMADDSDADDDDSFTVTQIAVTGGSNSSVAGSSTYNSNGTSVTGTYGTLVVGANGTYTYVADQDAADDLDAGDTATDSFTYTISDGDATDTATLIITVTGVNDAPVAVNDTDSVNEDATVTRTSGSSLLMADDSDADDDDSFTVTQIAVTGASNSAVSSGTTNSDGTSVTGTYGTLVVGANGTYTYVADQDAADDLDAGDTATDSFTYTISDGTDTDTATLIITVTGVNDAPVAVNDTDSVNVDATVTRTTGSSLLMADDSDADDDDSFTVTQIAVTGASNSAVAGSSTYNSNGTSVTGTYGTLVVGANGTYTYVADQDAADDLDSSDTATDSFTYTISDGTATDTATLIITVTGANDAPVAVNDTDSVNEDATVTQTSGSSLLMADDSDADGDSFTVTQIAVTGGSNSSVAGSSTYNSNGTSVTGTYGTLVVGANGTYTYVADQDAADDLDAGDTATDSFTYTISDGDATDTATLIITVTGVNDAPVAVNDTDSVNEDATVTRTTGSSLLMADDSDADDDDSFTVTQIAVTGASNSAVSSGTTNSDGTSVTGTYGTLVVGANGTYTYVADQDAADDLDAGDTATDSFTYTISDGTDTDTATLIITVTGVNDAPVAVNDTDSVNEDATVTRTSGSSLLMADDSDADDDDSFTVTQIAVTGASNSAVSSGTTNSNGTSVTGTYGTLVVGANGTYTYVADQDAADDLDAGDTATDSFTYTISDGDATDTATLIITVTGVNDAPVAVNDTDSVNEDATVTRTTGSSLLMADDSDADDDDSFTVTQIAVTGGSNSSVAGSSTYNSNGTSVTGTYGTLVVGANGTYTYVADQDAADDLDAGDTATDSFTYTISDGTDTDTATLIITVTGVNDAPVAVNDTDSVNEDATVTRTSGSSLLMADDSDADDDDSFTVTQIAVTGGSNFSCWKQYLQ